MNRRFFASVPHTADDLLHYPIEITGFEPKLAICYEKGKHLHTAEICFLKEARALFAGSKNK